MNITSLRKMKIFKNEENRLLAVLELSLPKIIGDSTRGVELFNGFYSALAELYIEAVSGLSKKIESGFLKVAVDYTIEKLCDGENDCALLAVHRTEQTSRGYKRLEDDFFDIKEARIISKRKYNKNAAKD